MEQLTNEGSKKLSEYGQFGKGIQLAPGNGLEEESPSSIDEMLSIGLGKLTVMLTTEDAEDGKRHVMFVDTTTAEVLATVNSRTGYNLLNVMLDHLEDKL